MSDGDERRKRLVLDDVSDQLDQAFRLLRGDADQAADIAFAGIGVDSRTEARLLGQLARKDPLAYPDRFVDAHRLAMRGLEVLDRDGHRHPRLPRLWFLGSLAEPGVEYVARYVVQSHVSDVVRGLSRLYARRESQAQPLSEERRMLARARAQTDRLSQGFRGAVSPLTTIVAGGAAIPLLASAAKKFGGVPLYGWGIALIIALLAVVFAVMAWVLIQGAGLAHRRASVVLAPPLRALYETIGDCGDPPQDDGRSIAAGAIALTAIAWFVLPPVVIAVLALVR
ncbi:MAG: hypothetical protein ACTHNU_02735 [Gaiellales bacterium]